MVSLLTPATLACKSRPAGADAASKSPTRKPVSVSVSPGAKSCSRLTSTVLPSAMRTSDTLPAARPPRSTSALASHASSNPGGIITRRPISWVIPADSTSSQISTSPSAVDGSLTVNTCDDDSSTWGRPTDSESAVPPTGAVRPSSCSTSGAFATAAVNPVTPSPSIPTTSPGSKAADTPSTATRFPEV